MSQPCKIHNKENLSDGGGREFQGPHVLMKYPLPTSNKGWLEKSKWSIYTSIKKKKKRKEKRKKRKMVFITP